jgi:hypothetical protein
MLTDQWSARTAEGGSATMLEAQSKLKLLTKTKNFSKFCVYPGALNFASSAAL